MTFSFFSPRCKYVTYQVFTMFFWVLLFSPIVNHFASQEPGLEIVIAIRLNVYSVLYCSVCSVCLLRRHTTRTVQVMDWRVGSNKPQITSTSKRPIHESIEVLSSVGITNPSIQHRTVSSSHTYTQKFPAGTHSTVKHCTCARLQHSTYVFNDKERNLKTV